MNNYYLSNEFRSPHKVWNSNSINLINHPSYEELDKSEYPDEFKECDQLAHNRMILGSFRYGLIKDQKFLKYNTPREGIKRIEKYLQDGNLEHLVDALNMIKISFMVGKRFKGQKMNPIDDGEHAQPTN